MFAKERQDQIYELIQKQGNVIVSDLVERFQVSIETIRRDLLCMEESGLLVRVHGGAVLIDRQPGGGTRITMSLAIHQSNAQLRFNPMTIDYCSERDHSLVELSEILPDTLYKKEY